MSFVFGDYGPPSDREGDGEGIFPVLPCPGCSALEIDDCQCEPADSEMAAYIAVVGDVRESEAQSDAETWRINAAFEARYCAGEGYSADDEEE